MKMLKNLFSLTKIFILLVQAILLKAKRTDVL